MIGAGSGYRKRERGVALLLVVSVISLLTVVVLRFNRNMRGDLVHSHHYRDRAQLQMIVDSGIDLALAVLYSDNYLNDFDCLHDDWAHVAGEEITELGGRSKLNVNIIDLSGRFPVNSLVSFVEEGGEGGGSEGISPEDARKVLHRLLLSGSFAVEDDLQAREIIDALVDWLDSDDKESEYGAEDSYYQSLEDPYLPRNGKMESPNELLAVKGLTPEILYGRDEKLPLADYITVYGTDGKININTAEALLLSVMHEDTVSDDGDLLVDYRSDEAVYEALEDSGWYKEVPGWPGNVTYDEKLIDTKSTHFRIESTAELGGIHMTMTAYVKRTGKKELEVLYRKLD